LRSFDEMMGTEILKEGIFTQVIDAWKSEIVGFDETNEFDSIEKMFLSKFMVLHSF
jgi:hypothetical protein